MGDLRETLHEALSRLKAALALGLVSSAAITGAAGVLKGGLQILKKHFGFHEC